MIAGLISMGLGEVTTTFENPVFIGEIKTEVQANDPLSLVVDTQELSLILE